MLRLRKAVYGLINAPLRWHQRLSRALRQAGFVPFRSVKSVSSVDVPTKLRTAVADFSVSPATETRTDRWERQSNVQGVLPAHVDDPVGGGNLTLHRAVQWLPTELVFGIWDQSRFRFRGTELSQKYNRTSIKISMSKFVQDMEPVAFPSHSKDDLDAALECCHLPLESCKAGQLLPNGHHLLSLNTLMRVAESMLDLCRWIVSVPSSFVWLTAADAAWASRPDGSSTSGHVIMAAHPNILRGESSTVSVLAWNSRKIRRVVRSSPGTECAACVQPSPLVWNILTCSE